MLFFKEPELPTLPWIVQTPAERTWELSDVLFELQTRTGQDPVYLADVLRGVQVFGANGSGKTSGIGAALSLSYLRAGFGGLILCVKKDEADLWAERCEKANRAKDLVVIKPGCTHTYNILDGAIQGAGEPGIVNAVRLLLDLSKLSSRGSHTNKDAFWDDQLRDLMTEVIYLSKLKSGVVNARTILSVLKSGQEFTQQDSSTSALNRHPFEEEFIKLTDEHRGNRRVEDCAHYFLRVFKEIPEKTRATIVAMFMSVIKPLTMDPLEQLFCSGTTVEPSDTFNGKIVVVDVSVHEFKEVGQLSQIIWKTVFLNAVMARVNPSRPVFLWADESQYFAEEKDVLINTTARSLRLSINYLTQSLPNYYSQIGSRDTVDAIIGSLIFKVFHQNTDPKTNEWASESIGKVSVQRVSVSSKGRPNTFLGSSSLNNYSASESVQFDLEPRVFTNLKEGGFLNHGQIEGVVHLPRKLSSGKTWVVAEFGQ